jgi:hypothetical protein
MLAFLYGRTAVIADFNDDPVRGCGVHRYHHTSPPSTLKDEG